MLECAAPTRIRSVPETFAEQTQLTPDMTAVVQDGERLSYRELDEYSNRIARRLVALGAGPGSYIGTFVERRPDTVAALLAVLKIGAAYVPLDPTYPAVALRHAMTESCAALMVVHGSLWDRVPDRLGWTGPLLRLDADADDIAGEDGGPLQLAVAPDDLAYIMFTSGSTGRPKGVMIPHRGIVRLVCDANYGELGPGEVFLLLSPLAFDASTFEIWAPLLNGSTLALAPNNLPSLREIADVIRQYGVTVLFLTTGLFHLIVDQHIEALRPVRHLYSGGDVMSSSHLEKARRSLPYCRLTNAYGPTENTTYTCCYSVPPDREVKGAVPIGMPLANTTVYILDEDYRPVPEGEVGQLCTGGAGLALGYLNDPDLTARKFIPDSRYSGERLYLTGDLARRDLDGNLHFHGRLDRQVKINGKRLELDEVENALHAHPEVREAAAALFEDRPGLKRIVAYVSGMPDTSGTVETLRAYLRMRLPEHAVPAVFMILDALPLAASGKLDRPALPRPRLEPTSPKFEQHDALERLLAALWGEVLRLNDVNPATNFFDLGGTSLQLIEAVERIQTSLHPALELADVFEHPTVLSLAQFIRGSGAAARSAVVGSDRAQRANDTLARLQQRRTRPVA